MTENKPIYVNGVNVSECVHYKNNGKCRIPHYQQGIKYTCCNCNEWDCNFKQLARKTQLEERLIKQIQTICDFINNRPEIFKGIYGDVDKIITDYAERKEQECEELKLQLTSLSYVDEICALEIDLKHRTQECEELKKANDEKNELLAKLGCPTTATAKMKVHCLQEQLDQLKSAKEQAEQKLDTIRKYCNYMSAFNNANKTNKGLDVEEVIRIIDEVENE